MLALLVTSLKLFVLLDLILLTVFALVYLERKIFARIQQRMGPMRAGPHGTLQSLADAIKLLLKEDLAPEQAERLSFSLAPILVFLPSFLVFVPLPFSEGIVVRNLDLGLLYFVAVSSLSTVGMVLAGWASANKYALIGAARSAAQLISYEVPMVLVVLSVAMLGESLNLRELVLGQSSAPYLLFQPLGAFIFLLAALAEVFRPPFDIPVADSEVLGGPMIEYSGVRWALFFVAEYANGFALAMLGSLIFLGGWLGPVPPPLEVPLPWGGALNLFAWVPAVWLLLKSYLLVFLLFWARGAMPRLRIDQLMGLAWQVLLPFAFLNLFFTGVVKLYHWPFWTLSLLSVAAIAAMGWMVGRGLQPWRPSLSAAS